MKKIIVTILLCVCLVGVFASCRDNKKIVPDYINEEVYETALENGDYTTGKTVTFTVCDVKPNSMFGYNVCAGKHLNFVAPTNPDVVIGDTLTVRILAVRSVLESWIIDYELISKE